MSYADELFWLVYTDVKRLEGSFKDAHNYVVTAPAIEGPWSDPIYVNSTGFDPSLFHDEDGQKWFLNMKWNYRGPGTGQNPSHPAFDGIELQRWSPEGGLEGPVYNIWAGSTRGLTEAPHLFRRGDWYYLTTAEGGTSYDHAVSLARARDITGPYESHPSLHVLTTADVPEHPIQRVGHGQIVELADGSTYHTFLMGRPLPGRVCPLGRESGIARCVWGADDWLYLDGDGMAPPEFVPAPTEVEVAPRRATETTFADGSLPSEFQWLRTPEPDRLFRLEPGALVLVGRESLGSWFEQSLVARRQEDFAYRAETAVTFDAEDYTQAAGLVAYYNRYKYHACMISWEPGLGRCLRILSCEGNYPAGAVSHPQTVIALANGQVELAVDVKETKLQFWFRQAGEWQAVGAPLDATSLSDEAPPGAHQSFTGAFVGMAAFDLTGQGREARFTRFSYAPTET